MPVMRRTAVHCAAATLFVTLVASTAAAAASVRVTAPVAGAVMTGKVVLRADAPVSALRVDFSVRWADADNAQRWHRVGRDADPRDGFAITWNSAPVAQRRDVRVRVAAYDVRGRSVGRSTTVRVRGGLEQVAGVFIGPNTAKPGMPFRVRGACVGCSVNLRREPSTASPPVGTARDGDILDVTCQVRGQLVITLAGIADIWDRLTDGRYVSDLYLETPGHGQHSPIIPWC
jgi:hypothetical protein